MSATKIQINPNPTYDALIQRVIGKHPAFQGCRAETRESLLRASSVRPFARGESVTVRGGPVDALPIVLSGSLEVGMHDPDGKHYVRWYLEPGQLQSFIPLIDGKGAIYDSRAHSDALLLQIPRDVLMTAVAEDHELMQSLLLMLCERSRAIHETAAAEVLMTLGGRVARMLLLLIDAYGRESGAGLELSLKLSQDEFAAMLGVTRQSLNRELKAFEGRGVIKIAYSRITVLDVPALRRVARIEKPEAPLD